MVNISHFLAVTTIDISSCSDESNLNRANKHKEE